MWMKKNPVTAYLQVVEPITGNPLCFHPAFLTVFVLVWTLPQLHRASRSKF